MAYKPITWGEKTPFDISEALSKTRPSPPSTSLPTKDQSFRTRVQKNLRNPVAGTVEGEEALPSNVASFVYPMATSTETQKESGKSAKARNAITRMNDYLDDRAQARYVSTALAAF